MVSYHGYRAACGKQMESSNDSMAMYLHIDGVDVYYDKIHSSVTFTYFEQYILSHLVIYVIECMIFWTVTIVMVFPIECQFSF